MFSFLSAARKEHQDNIRGIRKAISAAKLTVTRSERHRMIEIAAYYLAEKRSFAPGHHVEDWLEAERCIDAILERP
jgi:hypothetical protein